MTIDTGIWTQVGVGLAAAGVVATLIAPRLSKSARISAQVTDVAPIRTAFVPNNLEI